MKFHIRLLLVAVALGTASTPMSLGTASAAVAAPPNLYVRLGGDSGTRRIAGAFIDELASDARLMKNPRFSEMKAKVKLPEAKSRFAQELCHASGGPCPLNPKPLIVNAPPPSSVGAMEWFYIIDDANAALDKAKVPAKERAELLSLLMSRKG
jgi:hypothetical protein